MQGPHELTRLGSDILAGLADFRDALESGATDRPYATATWTAADGRTTASMTAADLVAAVADMDRRYGHLPIGVRASEGAIAAIRAAADEVCREVDPPGVSPGMLGGFHAGLPIYLDSRLAPGDWRFMYSWDEMPADDGSRRDE